MGCTDQYCKTDFYLDEDDQICKDRSASSDITNCLYYSEQLKCLMCSDGFAPDATGDACPGTTTNISDCNYVIQALGICAHCINGKVYDAASNSCVDSTIHPDCSVFDD